MGDILRKSKWILLYILFFQIQNQLNIESYTGYNLLSTGKRIEPKKVCRRGESKATSLFNTIQDRRDSFVTHRAFCDALTQETSRTITANPLLKTEHEFQQRFNPRPEMPSWLVSESTVQARQLGPIPTNYIPSSSLLDHQAIIIHDQENPNPNPPHMSATALLQKAEQMGVTMSSKTSHQQHDHMILTGRPHKALHHMMSGNGFDSTTCGGSGIGLPSREEIGNVLIHGLASYGNNKAAIINSSAACTEQQNKLSSTLMPSSTSRFQELAFQDSFNEMMNQKSESNFEDEMFTNSTSGQDCLTRDFLGVRAFPHTDFLNMSSLDHQIGSSSQNQTQNQPPRRS